MFYAETPGPEPNVVQVQQDDLCTLIYDTYWSPEMVADIKYYKDNTILYSLSEDGLFGL